MTYNDLQKEYNKSIMSCEEYECHHLLLIEESVEIEVIKMENEDTIANYFLNIIR